MPSFSTLSGPVSLEIAPIKKSRFVGDAADVGTADEAMSFVRTIQARHPEANHHCFAWRLDAGDRGWRTSDDGEPGGTAGMPILARIDGAGLRGVVVVVTRWFGGTKLGKGGLIRAYGGAASAVLAKGKTVIVHETRELNLTLGYEDQGTVEGLLRARQLTPHSQDFGMEVRLKLSVPTEELDALRQALVDGTAGRVMIIEG